MSDLIRYIVESIVSHPDEIEIEEEDRRGRTIYLLHVCPDDKGKIIGRAGRIAQSIRALLRVAAVKQDARVVLEIV